ncbi:MAG: HD domain-containing protein [Candidatus Parcubacteria bacterium]|nr:HD domain-containing protein [Candidatus Parcubacteria bacterium]
MDYEDRIYGKTEITEPVILELINSSTVLRLKEIDQAGYSEPHFPGIAHSRFEHSIGVYLLLKIYGASIEEQIAGLIHDVSHSAFSHCIDYALDVGSEKEHNYQDSVFDDFVRKSEIPVIIKKYNLDLEYILDDKNFPLKEKDLPDLCADRIDYSLRLAIISEEINNGIYFLDNLIAEDGKWVFKNFESAQKYADLFLKLNTNYYAGLSSAVMFRTVGDYLRYALKQEYILEKDFYTTDKKVLDKIEKFLNKDEKLRLLFDRMNNKIKIINNPDNYDVIVFCKSRVVDPLFKKDGEMIRISEFDLNWDNIVRRESKPKQYFLKFSS